MKSRASRPSLPDFDDICPPPGMICSQGEIIGELRQGHADILVSLRGDGTEDNPGVVVHVREIARWIEREEKEETAKAEHRRAVRTWALGVAAAMIASATGLAIDHVKSHNRVDTAQAASSSKGP